MGITKWIMPEPIPAFAAPPSWNEMQISDTVRKGVVFLGWKEGDKFIPKATGFIMRIQEEDFLFGYIVTAQHCVGKLYEPDEYGNRREVFFSLNRWEGPPALIKVDYKEWWNHPDTSQVVDVAVLWTGLDERIYDYTWGGIEFVLTADLIREKEIGVGDEVAIVGLFRNHAGRKKNIPIVRIGNISAMPDEPVWTQYGNIEAYLIEARSIGGLSGSPVFLSLGSWRSINSSYTYQGTGLPFYLLGLMHGHFDVKDLNADVVLDLEEATPVGIHSGIGVVIPASKIVETLMQKDLVEQRKETIRKAKSESTVIPDFASSDVTSAPSAPSADDANPNHLADFKRLVDVAARKRPQGDQT